MQPQNTQLTGRKTERHRTLNRKISPQIVGMLDGKQTKQTVTPTQ